MQHPTKYPRPTRRGALVAVAVLALTAAGAGVTGVAAGKPRPHAAVPRAVTDGAQSVTRSHVRLVGRTSPTRAARARFAPSGTTTPRRPLSFLVPRQGSQSTPTGSAVPRVQSSPESATTKVLHKFDGVTGVQNDNTAFPVEPPDEGLGAGNGYVANFVNVTGAFYNESGTMLGRPFYLNTFFKEDPATNTSDPRVFYDTGARRWYATMVEYQFNDAFTRITESHVDLATSKTADPTGAWRVFRIRTSDLNHANCPCLADYPMLGFDNQNVYVTTAEFTTTLDGYNGAQLYAISKKQLLAGATDPNMVRFQNLAAGGELAGHVQPALTYGSSSAEYLVSGMDAHGNGASSLAVWAVTNRGAVTTGDGMPALGVRVVPSEHYALPPNARTPVGFCAGCGDNGEKTTGLLATDFDETFEVQYINGQVVTTLHTAVQVAGDTAERSGVAWFVIRPHVSGRTVTSDTKVARQGYIARKGIYLLYPHINMTPDGSMAVVFSRTASNIKPQAAYAVAPPGGRFGPIQVYGYGQAPDNGFTATPTYGGVGRWGDYSNGQIVPGTQQVWLATQYIPNEGDGAINWGNKIVHLQLP